MAKDTRNIILDTFADMLERMPMEKITVTELVKECHIGRNTFYYHYNDIYDLLDDKLKRAFSLFWPDEPDADLKSAMKKLLYACRDNRKTVYHIYHAFSADFMVRHVFSRTDTFLYSYICRSAQTRGAEPENLEVIADIVKYSAAGFILHFLGNDMKDDIEESVDKAGEVFEALLDRMLR